jgi:hypothetical protein
MCKRVGVAQFALLLLNLLTSIASCQSVATPTLHGNVHTGPSPSFAMQARVKSAFSQLPLRFEENQGQASDEIRFLSRGAGYSLWLTGKEAVLAQRTVRNSPNTKSVRSDSKPPELEVFRLQLAGANQHSRVEGLEPLSSKTNYFIGKDPKKWRTNVPSYSKVRYHDVYPGVDLVYYGNQAGKLEYDFVVAPGADARQIELDVQSGLEASPGVQPRRTRLTAKGDLILHGSVTDLRLQKPVIYQQDDKGGRHYIAGSYLLRTGKPDTANQNSNVTFEISGYDHSKPLVIDPAITYSTYFGGAANSVAVYTDPVTGHVYAYLAGGVCDPNFPTKNALQPTFTPQGCAGYIGYGWVGDTFVAKFDPSAAGAESLVWSTYLGSGDNAESASGIGVDTMGNAYVTGNTNSLNFPTINAFQSARKSPSLTTYYPATTADAFLSKLSADGSTLLYSSYFGGSGGENSHAIALDSTGRAYIAGQTWSPDLPTVNPFQGTLRATGGAAFLAIFDPTLSGPSSLVYATYLGGSSTYQGDPALALAVDAAGGAHLGGFATSPDFPIVNGFQNTFTASTNVGMSFYAMLNPFSPPASQLVYSTYLGAAAGFGGFGGVTGVTVDSSGKAYLVGTGVVAQIPVTPGAYQGTVSSGDAAAFIAKINPSLTGSASLIYCARFPFNAGDSISSGIALDPGGNLFISGHAQGGFPLVNPIQNPSDGVFQSVEGGNSWASLTKGLDVDSFLFAFAVDTTTSPRTLYTGTLWGGVYTSSDGGLNWNHVFQLPNTAGSNTCSISGTPCVFALAVDPTAPSNVYAGTSLGLYRSTDRGATWSTLNSGLSSIGAQSATGLQFDGGTLYAATSDALYRLPAGSSSWTSTGLTVGMPFVTIDPFSNPHTIYAFGEFNGQSEYKSIDGGTTWTPFGDTCLTGLAVDTTTTPSTLYGTEHPICGSTFVKSTDGGNTWIQLDSSGEDTSVDPYGPQIVVDSTRTPSIIYGKTQVNLLESKDGGVSWKGVTPNVGKNPLGFIALDPTTATTTSPATLYVGTNTPLPHIFVAELNSSGSALLFSTNIGGGLGEDYNSGNDIATDAAGNVYVTGGTNSIQFPVVNAFQPSAGSAFFTKIGTQSLPPTSSNPVSTQVGVPIGTLTVSFPNITGSSTGNQPTLAVSPLSSADTANFSLSNNLGAYDISTTASYSGTVSLCFQALTVNDLSTFNNLQLVHVVNGSLVNITSSHDFSTRTVCGSTASFSPFVLVNGTPKITWNNPQAITYGTALSSAQLNAIADIQGTFTYTPTSGSVLGPGKGQTLSVTFTPANPAIYRTVTKTASIDVLYSTASCNGDTGHTILQPINANGSSVFKLGSTVPTKFRVCDANGVSVGIPGTVTSYQLVAAGAAIGLSVDEQVYSTAADTAFRWDSTTKQWVFNQGTGKNNPTLSQPNELYVFRINLKDGTSIQFQYGLK